MALLRITAVLAAALAIDAAAPRPAAACSVCLAGDPLYSSQGTTAQQEGDFSVYFQVQGWRKDAGMAPHGAAGEEDSHEDEHAGEEGFERNRSQRLDLFLSWTPLDRLTLTLDIPYAFNRIEEIEPAGSTTNRLDGLGDVAISGTVVLWRNREVLPSAWIEGRAFLEFPTGRTDREKGGSIDPHLQTGSGSWDFGFGLAAVRRLAWSSLYTSAFYRENRSGDFGDLEYEYGDVVLWNAALEVPVGHALGRPSLAWLTAGAELNFRFADYDRADGERFDDSGGSILYATPSLRLRLPLSLRERPLSLRLAVQLPLTSAWLNGFQDEGEVWSAGLLVPF